MGEVIVWAGWVGGTAIGLYMLVQYWYTGVMLGCSAAYCNPLSTFSKLELFSTGEYACFNNWRLWFSIGIPLGAAVAALTSPGYEWQLTLSMGEMYDTVLPESTLVRIVLLFAGGLLMGYGARLAGGCTSGHVISGVSLLNQPSVLAAALFFIGGLISVQLLFYVFK